MLTHEHIFAYEHTVAFSTVLPFSATGRFSKIRLFSRRVNYFLSIVLLGACLSGCKERPESVSLKPGAWEITSTFDVHWEGVPDDLREKMSALDHAELRAPRTVRLCVQKEDKMPLPEAPSSSCTSEIKQSSPLERVATFNCVAKDGKKSQISDEFRLDGSDSYVNVSHSSTETSVAHQRMTMVTTMTNKGRYLGLDCKAFEAKKINQIVTSRDPATP